MSFVIFVFAFLFSSAVSAQTAGGSDMFAVPDDEEIPNLIQLEKQYREENGDYQWHYDFSWLHPETFDTEFDKRIKYFGSTEKRIESEQEETLYRMIKRMPATYYPYIGPELHNIPGLSGKILDMPGIKETKNQFPKRIASQFTDIPNLEFLSPSLYIYLMPEIWGEGFDTLETPQGLKKNVRIKTTPRPKNEDIKEIIRLIPYGGINHTVSQKNKKGVRHFIADANTPLSAADVEAFVGTLEGVKKFNDDHKNKLDMISYGQLITYWDKKNNGVDEILSLYKGMVNPCQSAVRRLKWAGKGHIFQDIIGTKGFGLDDWAQICDKTLKAYRKGSMSNAHVTVINVIKSGAVYNIFHDDDNIRYTPEERRQHKIFFEAFLQTYTAPLEEVRTVLPYKKQIRKQLQEFDNDFLGSPLVLP